MELENLDHITIADIIDAGKSIRMDISEALPYLRHLRDRLSLTDREMLDLVRIYKRLNKPEFM